jgi:hypothetical protein
MKTLAPYLSTISEVKYEGPILKAHENVILFRIGPLNASEMKKYIKV